MSPRLATDYEEGLTRASMSALLELSLTLKSYRESIVLVGGWVPYFLIEQSGQMEPIMGSVGQLQKAFSQQSNEYLGNN
jgi:hypothetical protein